MVTVYTKILYPNILRVLLPKGVGGGERGGGGPSRKPYTVNLLEGPSA